MRHLLWFVIGLVLAVVGLLTAAFGAQQVVEGLSTADDASRTLGHVLVLVAGLVLGLLVASRRFSAGGPLAGGLLFLGVGIVFWVLPQEVPRALSRVSEGLADAAQSLFATGLGLLLGVVLLVVALLPSARRERRAKGDDGRADDGFAAVPRTAPQAWSPPQG